MHLYLTAVSSILEKLNHSFLCDISVLWTHICGHGHQAVGTLLVYLCSIRL